MTNDSNLKMAPRKPSDLHKALDDLLSGDGNAASLAAFKSLLEESITATPDRAAERAARGSVDLSSDRAEFIEKYAIRLDPSISLSFTIPAVSNGFQFLRDAQSLSLISNGSVGVDQYALERFSNSSDFLIHGSGKETSVDLRLFESPDTKKIDMNGKLSRRDCVLSHQVVLALTGRNILGEHEAEIQGTTLWYSPQQGLGIGASNPKYIAA